MFESHRKALHIKIFLSQKNSPISFRHICFIDACTTDWMPTKFFLAIAHRTGDANVITSYSNIHIIGTGASSAIIETILRTVMDKLLVGTTRFIICWFALMEKKIIENSKSLQICVMRGLTMHDRRWISRFDHIGGHIGYRYCNNTINGNIFEHFNGIFDTVVRANNWSNSMPGGLYLYVCGTMYYSRTWHISKNSFIHHTPIIRLGLRLFNSSM